MPIKAIRKEIRIKNLIEETFEEEFVHDKKVPRSRLRPDFRYVGEDHIVVVEVDEHQHRQHSMQDEIARMQEIHRCLKKPIIFIRYNPDCKVPHEVKHAKLVEKIRECMGKKVHDIVITYLFYTNYDDVDYVIPDLEVLSIVDPEIFSIS